MSAEMQITRKAADAEQFTEELWRKIIDLITGTDISLEELATALETLRRRALRLKAEQQG